jgi:hypothetical protein
VPRVDWALRAEPNVRGGLATPNADAAGSMAVE